MTKHSESEDDVVVSMDAVRAKRRGRRAATGVDDIVDALLGSDPVRKPKRTRTKRAKPATADDIVDSMLGGELEGKQRKKHKQHADTSDDQLEQAQQPDSDDDVADLYAWENIAEEEPPAATATSPDEKEQPADNLPTMSKPVRVLPAAKLEAAGRYVALDCEMVGCGPKGSRSQLARVSLVNYHGHVLLDAFVRPAEPVTDYRTWVSGIRKDDLKNGRPFADVQREVAELLTDRVLVGHALKNDLAALMLTHPPLEVRDTARYPGFRVKKGSAPALRVLAQTQLNLTIQQGEHSSVVDAKTCMLLYRKVKVEWEKLVAPRRYKAQVVKAKTKERFAKLRQEIKEQQQQR
ncbi:3'-5' exonuclease [Coemansia sp. RSA 2706]|nr:3'-5' exonuclease [Coemansia sp. RSA 2706]KAJ2306285.1 3'-5' exonuclease [Coemansia sp. RSA 2705]